jgi:integrase
MSQYSSDTPLLLFASDQAGDPGKAGFRFNAILRLCTALDKELGRRSTVADLTADNFLFFCQALADLQPATLRRTKAVLRNIWNQAIALKLLDRPDGELYRFLASAPETAVSESPPPDGKTSLMHVADAQYFPLNVRCKSEKTRYAYRLSFRSFGRFLERTACLEDLTDDNVTRWVKWLEDQELATHTVREIAGRVQALWNFCAKRRLVEMFPTFQKPRPTDTMPRAMTEDQIRALFASAAKERGEIEGIPAGIWWRSFLAFVWVTAERKSAVLAVRIEWLDLDRQVCVIPPASRKGGVKWGIHALWPELVPVLKEAIDAKPGRELVWPFPFTEGSFYTRYNRILADAGIPVTRKTKTHGLRASHATYLKLAGGDPTQQLGHADALTTAKHYLDPTLCRVKQPQLFVPWQPANAEGGAE